MEKNHLNCSSSVVIALDVLKEFTEYRNIILLRVKVCFEIFKQLLLNIKKEIIFYNFVVNYPFKYEESY